jgi:hypothetical protein
MQPLLVARKQPPPVAAVYELAGDTLARSAGTVTRDEAVMVVEGAQLFPLRLKLIFQASVLAADIGETQSAHALADHGIKHAPDANARKRFEDLKAALPPAPPAPEPAGATSPAATPASATKGAKKAGAK